MVGAKLFATERRAPEPTLRHLLGRPVCRLVFLSASSSLYSSRDIRLYGVALPAHSLPMCPWAPPGWVLHLWIPFRGDALRPQGRARSVPCVLALYRLAATARPAHPFLPQALPAPPAALAALRAQRAGLGALSRRETCPLAPVPAPVSPGCCHSESPRPPPPSRPWSPLGSTRSQGACTPCTQHVTCVSSRRPCLCLSWSTGSFSEMQRCACSSGS